MTDCFRRRASRRLAWMAGAAVIWWAGAAAAQDAYAVSLDASRLEPALLALAGQTRQQILFSKTAVAGLRAPALHGRMTPEAALAQLLAGTGLEAHRVSATVVVVERRAATGQTDGEAAAQHPFGMAEAALGEAPAPALPTAAAATTTVEEVKVTGSHIRGAHTASPALSVGRADLARSGYATLAGALDALPQNFGGAASEGSITTSADKVNRNVAYGSAINLRGLGNDATLVLINGRRVAGAGSFGDFVDLSSIPTAAVDRVEILLDGASALYGADAVAGVVNVILRRDMDGAETRLYAGTATDKAPWQFEASQSLGKRWEGGGLLLALDYQYRSSLPGADRPYTASSDLRPLGGTDQRINLAFPGNILTAANVPGWAIPAGQTGAGLTPGQLLAGQVNLGNQRQGEDTLPRQELQAAYLTAHQALGERLEVAADVRYAFRKFAVTTAVPTADLTVTRANPFFVSPNGTTSETIAYSFLDDIGNGFEIGSDETWGVTASATLRLFGDWKSDAYLGFGSETMETHVAHQLQSFNLAEALGNVPDRPQTAYSPAVDGYFNPFGGAPGADSAAVDAFIGSGYAVTRTVSRAYVGSVEADGTLLTLPSGPVKLALGAQLRRETLARTGASYAAALTETPQASADLARDSAALFAELQAPLIAPDPGRRGLERLEASLAGRIEHYQAVGTTSNPKVGVVWTPLDGLNVRATYGTSFRAPALTELTQAAVFTPILLSSGPDRIRALVLQGGNAGLRPETATSYTLGVDLRPAWAPGLSASITGFDIDFRNRIDRPVVANIAGALTDPTLASFVERISPATNAGDLAAINALLANPALSTSLGTFPATAYGAIVDARYVNTGALRVRGLDVSAAYRTEIGGDPVSFAANATYTADYQQQITPTSASVQRVGIAGFPVRFRSRVTADWTHGPVSWGAAFNYIGAYRDVLGVRIGDQPTVDLQARWRPSLRETWAQGTELTLAVRNLFDRAPPFYNNVSGVGYDPTNADPIGRFVSVQLTRRW